MKKILLIHILLLGYAQMTIGQITVTTTQTPEQMIQGVLLGNGIVASNIKYNGVAANAQINQANVSFFSAGSTSFPIPSGVLLTTGGGNVAVGPNNSGGLSNPITPIVNGDPDLQAIAGTAIVTNGVFLEFDFVPQGDSVSFNYLFASEEYPEFAPPNGGVNDVFGFFISGPGITGPYQNNAKNLAVIPNTTIPITINNVNAITNPAYYLNNMAGAAYGNAIQYDGSTTVLKAQSAVQCGQTYHIKLAISNVQDQGWDSGVFLEAESFNSSQIEVVFSDGSVSSTGDTVLYEGCNSYDVLFIRPTSDTLLTIGYTITGTATSGADYPVLPNPVTFQVGQDTVVLTISAIADGITESVETITITVNTVTICGDTVTSTGTLYIYDHPPAMSLSVVDTVQSFCHETNVSLTAQLTGGFPGYTYVWTDLAGNPVATGGNPTILSGSSNGYYSYVVDATDACQVIHFQDTVVVDLNQTLAIDTIYMFPTSACKPNGAVSGFVSGLTGLPQYHWEGPGKPGPNNLDASVMADIPSGWYYFTIADNVCQVEDSVFVTQTPPPIAAFSGTPLSGCAPVNVVYTNTSQDATNYAWDFGNGQTVNVTDLGNQSATYTTSGTARLIASKGSCADTAYVTVTVTICGCTDPTALNYNPNASVDDGSCLYPTPAIIAPNIFTPNSDGENDFFELKMTNVTDLKVTVMNRWGNIVFEQNGLATKWDGKSQNGVPVEEGVYFYTYAAKGILGDAIEGHGFVEVIR